MIRIKTLKAFLKTAPFFNEKAIITKVRFRGPRQQGLANRR